MSLNTENAYEAFCENDEANKIRMQINKKKSTKKNHIRV